MSRRSELSAFSILGKMPKATIIQYPSGKFGFVGSVPAHLAYERLDGAPLTDEDIQDIRQVGVGMLKYRLRSRVFLTREDAEKALTA